VEVQVQSVEGRHSLNQNLKSEISISNIRYIPRYDRYQK
jgi:hypothetical protein